MHGGVRKEHKGKTVGRNEGARASVTKGKLGGRGKEEIE